MPVQYSGPDRSNLAEAGRPTGVTFGEHVAALSTGSSVFDADVIAGMIAGRSLGAGGVILAEAVNAQAADSPHLVPMIDQLHAHSHAIGVPIDERQRSVFSTNAGYCSGGNVLALEERGIDAYVASGREGHHRGGIDPHGLPRTSRRATMRDKPRNEAGCAIYARRTCITEPVHGMIKQAHGFHQFLLRGLTKVGAEFTLVALTHNLLKLRCVRVAPAPAR